MNTHEAIKGRILELCEDHEISPNHLGYLSGVSQSTIKSILNDESYNTGIITIKKLCDGLELPLPKFFDTPLFWNLEQEIK